MKFTLRSLQKLVILTCAVLPGVGSAATLLLDDFSTGGFSLGNGGTTSNSDSLVTPLTNQRTVSGVGDPNWTASLASGELMLAADQLDPSPGRTFFSVDYSQSNGTFSILGYDAFAVDLFNVVGTGELLVSVDGSQGRGVRVPIDSSGTLVSPFSNIETSQSLDSLTLVRFRFFARSEDFSLTIDNVRIVPEPSASMLLVLGAASALFHRRRND